MVHLKPVIEVQELPPGRDRERQHLPRLRDLASQTASPLERAILDYLTQGVTCALCLDHSYGIDRIEPRRIREACQSDPRLRGLDRQMGGWLTDGTWIWDGILPYYVAAYHLQLPDEFVRFALSRDWKIDPALDVKTLDTSAYDAVPAASHGQAHA
jgi:hypothetical protein